MKCRRCGQEFEKTYPDKRHTAETYAHQDGYCSPECDRIADDTYDAHFDPTGFYRNKNLELD